MPTNTVQRALLALAMAYLVSGQTTWDESSYESSPAIMPSPDTTGAGGWEAALAKAKDFVSDLTPEEKASMVTGTSGPCTGNIAAIPRKNFTGLCLQDGPLSIRQADYASVFPAGLTAAATWNKGLIHTRGLYLGEEFKAKGAHIALGPVAGPLGRSSLGGRNWEGFSPDPYLTATAFSLTAQGMQSAGVQACGKHFIGNEQETQRNPSVNLDGTTIESVSSNIDDRTMHELYLAPFAEAVRTGLSAVMCSYNRVNGSYACQNSKILNGLLKEELGFQGYVMSDWEGTHAGLSSIESGLDMNMPGALAFFTLSNASFFGGNITTALTNGSLAETRVDDMIARIMTPYFYQQQTDYPTVDPSSAGLNALFLDVSQLQYTLPGPSNRDVRANHAELIRTMGGEGAVLLKNTNNALPLKAPKNIGVFGNDATDLADGLYSLALTGGNIYGYENGVLGVGGGSGTGRLTYIVSPLEAIKARAKQDNALVQYITDNTVSATGISSVFPTPEVCLVFLKTWVTEGQDRLSYEADWNSKLVVNSVAASCNNTIVVTHSGGINTMPWASHPNITAIVAAHLGGQEAGNSIVDVLYGAVNPSGRLPYTVGNSASDYNAPIANATGTSDPNGWQSNFAEGLMIDYRHFDMENKSVLYEFGYGLSYTTFDASDLALSKKVANVTAKPPYATTVPGGNPTLYDVLISATAKVTNTGSLGGASVLQLYLSVPDSAPAGTPIRMLKGFEKISLEVGETAAVNFDLTRKDLSFWDVVAQDWEVPSGEFTISVGFSSRDLPLSASTALL